MASPITVTMDEIRTLHAWQERLLKRGLKVRELQQSIDNPSQIDRIIAFIRASAPVLPLEAVTASTRSAVYDARQINDLLLLGYTEDQLTAFGLPPDSLPGYLTLFDPGWDILRLRSYCYKRGQQIFRHQDCDWYDNQDFSKKQEEPRYRQIRIEAVVQSFNKIFTTQKALLPDTEEIPVVRQLVMGMVVHFLLTGQRLFPAYYVRCSEKDSVGRYIAVGDFGDYGLAIRTCNGDEINECLGLSSARKF